MTLMLVDAASLYFRAFYGVKSALPAPDGTPTNAVRGFLDMSARLITTHAPDRFVACWDDDWRPAFRTDALPSYKAHRVAGAAPVQGPAGVITEMATSPDTAGESAPQPASPQQILPPHSQPQPEQG